MATNTVTFTPAPVIADAEGYAAKKRRLSLPYQGTPCVQCGRLKLVNWPIGMFAADLDMCCECGHWSLAVSPGVIRRLSRDELDRLKAHPQFTAYGKAAMDGIREAHERRYWG